MSIDGANLYGLNASGKGNDGRVVTTFKYYASIDLQRLRNATDNLSLGPQIDYEIH
jgi:hypothetical protein